MKNKIEYRIMEPEQEKVSLLESVALAYQRCSENAVKCKEIADKVSTLCYSNTRYELLQEVGI